MTATWVEPTRVEVRTSDADVAHATLVQGYSPTRPVAFSGNFTDFEFSTSSVTAGAVTSATIRHSASTLALTEPYEPFIGGIARRGQLNFRTANEDVLVDRERAVRYSTDLPLAISWDNVDLLVVMFPLAVVAEAAEAQLDGREAFAFTSTAPASPRLSRFWRTTITHVDRELRAKKSALGYPLMQSETLNMLAAAALAVFPNTAMSQDYLPGSGAVGTAALRRAVGFIDANAHRSITLAEIATAAGVGPRALQQAFRRHRNTSPMQYLRRARLESAHRELRATNPAAGASVREVAARWGFGNAARFAAAYREAFGVSPDAPPSG